MAKLQLEVGKAYRTAGKRKAVVTGYIPFADTYLVNVDGCESLDYFADGSFILRNFPDYNIVAEWQDDEVTSLPQPYTNRVTFSQPHTPTCNHEYVNMSAFHIRMVCKHCDHEQK